MDSQTVGRDASQPQVDAVLREAAELTAAIKRARTVRLLLFLIMLGFVCVIGLVVVQKARHLTSDKNVEKVLAAASRHFEHNEPNYRRQLEALLAKIEPPLTMAFSKQAEKDLPLYIKTFEKQRKPFEDNLAVGFDRRLDHHQRKTEIRYEKLFTDEFPEFKDEKAQKRMAKHLDQAIQGMLKKYGMNDLRSELTLIFATIDQFPAIDEPKKGEESLESQLINALGDIWAYRWTHAQKAGPR